ncbi:MAG: hypothetical protein PUB43_06635, partial [Oscillospiraceae bacterium]|nr:hypothetical protein [Oscillospiraceae bacterium]
ARAHSDGLSEKICINQVSAFKSILATWHRTMSLKITMLAFFSRLEYHRVTHINPNPFFIRRIFAHSALKCS